MIGFWDSIGPGIGTMLLVLTTLERLNPWEFFETIKRIFWKILNFFNPNIEITFDEYPPESYGRSKAYDAIQSYLGANFSLQAERLKGNLARDKRSVTLSMDDYEEVTDSYNGVRVCWIRNKSFPRSNIMQMSSHSRGLEKSAYILSFPKKDCHVIIGSYLSHVLSEGKTIRKRNRGQRIFSVGAWGGDGCMEWSWVRFEHPATFDTLAMDPEKKKEIIDDLIKFTKGKEYYKKIGKPWKRGYLLYGSPGTGKSTMIAAMANFLHYDVYDLELTAVKDNTMLRRLMIDISKRAIVVIEDIDCSLDITGKRRGNDNDDEDEDNEEEDNNKSKKKSKVTLSGLLNFMDGLWSAGGERIFIFTTNHVDKLDQALIRKGRMDKHVEMSYCRYEAFKVFANNYLQIETHDKFDKIKCLLSQVDISPADVAENLMPKFADMGVDECLQNLIDVLRKSLDELEKEKLKEVEPTIQDRAKPRCRKGKSQASGTHTPR